MKVFLVVDETPFFQPAFLADFLSRAEAEVVGAALVTKVPRANSIEGYFRRNLRVLRIGELIRLLLQKISMAVRDRLAQPSRGPEFFSVRSVLRYFAVDFIEVAHDINRKEYLSYIRARDPDVIISSNPLIFREDLLSIPRIGCINRHSALLPSYGGVWPVFQAVRAGEAEVGVSVHWMDAGIDTGTVISQRTVPIRPGDSIADLYQKCFAISADVVLEALARIERNETSPPQPAFPASYFSFPTKAHWTEFRSRGGRFI